MSGLRCWNSAGQLTLEVSDRLARYHGSISVGSIGPRSSGNYSVPGYALDGRWFIFLRSGSMSWMQVTEQVNNINVFNADYYYARGNLVIDIFRG